MVTSVVPSWMYSYQCSSALLVNYIPVLLYSYLISGVLMPCLQVVYLRMSPSTLERWVPRLIIKHFVDNSIFGLSRKPPGTPRVESRQTTSIAPSLDPVNPLDPLNGNRADNQMNRVDCESEFESNRGLETSEKVPKSSSKPVFSSATVISKCWLDIAVCLTFGLACPLLLVCVFVDACTRLSLWCQKFQRFVTLHISPHIHNTSTDIGSKSIHNVSSDSNITFTSEKNVSKQDSCDEEALSRLEVCCEGAWEGSSGVLLLIVLVAGLFWSLFVFDMVGDVYGALAGGLVVIVPSLGSVVVCLALIVFFNSSHVSVVAIRRAVTETGINLTVMNPVANPESALNTSL